ncbi:uncharacterized protein LOC112167679 isoform X2 [Rosa chinensis]|uniref:uncharacterized protein LOC112167679 isoform X2 n=1 Tax=Rosa chinensis TaxID=74649 RepID=UPI001AD8FDDC|nr:uncharacterized protein LOC112167679 isoform X2 [Rosa chinensis]
MPIRFSFTRDIESRGSFTRGLLNWSDHEFIKANDYFYMKGMNYSYVHRGEAWAANKFRNMWPQLKEIMIDYVWQPNIADSLFELCYHAEC